MLLVAFVLFLGDKGRKQYGLHRPDHRTAQLLLRSCAKCTIEID